MQKKLMIHQLINTHLHANNNECYGNLISTCSLNILGRINGQKNIICLLENIYNFNRDFDLTLEYCLSSEPDVLQEIKDCVESDIYIPASNDPKNWRAFGCSMDFG